MKHAIESVFRGFQRQWIFKIPNSERYRTASFTTAKTVLPSSFDESLAQHPLPFPTRQDRNGTYFAFAESWDRVGGGFEVEKRLLDVAGEVGEVDELGNAGTVDRGTGENWVGKYRGPWRTTPRPLSVTGLSIECSQRIQSPE